MAACRRDFIVVTAWVLGLSLFLLAGPMAGAARAQEGGDADAGKPLHRLCLGENCRDFENLQQAVAAAVDKSLLTIAPGTYFEAFIWRVCGSKIVANGVHLKGVAYDNKAAIVVETPNDCWTSIIGLECSGIRVKNKNGACIRLTTGRLYLEDVNFHDSEQGILTSRNCATLFIQNSLFERLGKAGRAHGMYVNCDTFTIRGSKVLCPLDEGHGIKSGARQTIIEYTLIDSQNCGNSREIDIFCGGDIAIRNNIIRKGPASVNRVMIAIGKELNRCNYGGQAIISNNRFRSERKTQAHAIDSRFPVTREGNRFDGLFVDAK